MVSDVDSQKLIRVKLLLHVKEDSSCPRQASKQKILKKKNDSKQTNKHIGNTGNTENFHTDCARMVCHRISFTNVSREKWNGAVRPETERGRDTDREISVCT